MSRVQIPYAFSYSSGTVYVASSSGGSPTTVANVLEPVVGTAISVINRDTGNPASVYQAETGAATFASIITDAGGNVPGWVDPGSYKIQAAAQAPFAGATINFEAVRGDAVTNLATGSVGTLQIQAGAVTLAQLAAAVQQMLVSTGSVFDYVGSVAPAGYALCNGTGHQPSDSDWSTWSTLFGVIGTKYGAFGTGGFRLPNTQGRFTLGAGSGVSGATNLGDLGGALGHTHSVGTPSVTIALGTPSLSVSVPSVTNSSHAHGLSDNGGAQFSMEYVDGTHVNLLRGDGSVVNFTATRIAASVPNNGWKGLSYADAGVGLFGATDSASSVTNSGSSYGASGNLSAGQTASGSVNSGFSTGPADPAYLVFNKIIKL